MNNMSEAMEYLPFLLPVIFIEFGLFGYAMYHIFTHNHYKRGSRMIWVCICLLGINFIGPIAYLLFGKEDD